MMKKRYWSQMAKDTRENGEMNAEHYIQYHDELETILEEEDENPHMTEKQDIDELDMIVYTPEVCIPTEKVGCLPSY